MMIHDSWPFRVIRGIGPFVLLYLAVGFIVSIIALFVYGGIWPIVAIVVVAILLAISVWALLESGHTTDMQ